jgi:hypothetical protein
MNNMKKQIEKHKLQEFLAVCSLVLVLEDIVILDIESTLNKLDLTNDKFVDICFKDYNEHEEFFGSIFNTLNAGDDPSKIVMHKIIESVRKWY